MTSPFSASNFYCILKTQIIVAIIFCGSVMSIHSAETQWQIKLHYHKDGSLALLDAEVIPPMKKKARSPGLIGALFQIPIEIDWLNSDGIVLQQGKAAMPLGTRIPSRAEGCTGKVLDDEIFVLRITGPPTDLKPSQIRLRVKPSVDSAPTLLDTQTLNLPSTASSTLPSSSSKLSTPSSPSASLASQNSIGVTKIQDTGADSNRLVIVVMGDGYLQSDITSGFYATAVDSTLSVFSASAPWGEMMKSTNIYRLDVASNESGADYEDDKPGKGTLKDTYFNSAFWTSNIERLLSTNATGKARAIAAADDYVGVGVWDQIIIVVNSSKYGGAGGTLAVNSTHKDGPAIAIHEVGHSLAGLADEYFTNGTTYNGNAPTEPNVDINPTSPKWSEWLDTATPLPTPDTNAYNLSVVGAFEGGRYSNFGIFRPSRSCKMRSQLRDFCSVCKQAHLQTFFDIVSLTDKVTPDTAVAIPLSSSQTLSLTTLDLADLKYQWFLDGSLISGETSKSMTVDTSQLPSPSAQEIKVTIDYTSSLMRVGAPSETHSWIVQNTGVTEDNTPHWWLASYGLKTTAGADQIDNDRDGQTAASEYIAGTDPTDKSSTFNVQITASGANNIVTWDTVANRRYRLERSSNMSTWSPVPGRENLAGNGNPLTYSASSNSDEKLFFRVVVWIE